MLFNSLEFLIFLPLVFLGYWFCFGRSLRLQNLFVVAVSYVFYGWWDWRFLLLIALTSSVAWGTGLLIARGHGRMWVAVSLVINLGVLGFFKYFDFFAESAVGVLEALGFQAHSPTLRILLPVGISFYTFQALSYSIDVYRRSLPAVRDPVAFFAYISFFPQLVAGPIERATNLLPQFLRPRVFDAAEAVSGCRLMLWGFAKKCWSRICARLRPTICLAWKIPPRRRCGLAWFVSRFRSSVISRGIPTSPSGAADFLGFA